MKPTILNKLVHLDGMLQDELRLTLDDFFHTSINKDIRLQWSSRRKTLTFSELMQKIDAISKFSYIEEYSCEWDKEHHWFDITFKIQYDSDNWYEVNIVVH